MKRTIAGRELIVLDGGCDGAIRGTYHKTGNDGASVQSDSIQRDRVGVVFLNGLPATRAGRGDAVVYWADSLAERGYPSFRIDLPGFGDSDGEPPLEPVRFVDLGGYAIAASAVVKELTARFGLSGVVLVGHCAGAVSAIYAAAIGRECKGMVLVDPYFYEAHTERRKVRQRLSVLAERKPTVALARNIFGRLRNVWLSSCKNVYPDHANVPLLRRWKQVASTGLPILILKVPDRRDAGTKPRPGDFDYVEYIRRLAGRRSRVEAKSVEGANHTFSNGVGRDAVRRHTEQWLDANFPLAGHSSADARPLRPKAIMAEYVERCQPGLSG